MQLKLDPLKKYYSQDEILSSPELLIQLEKLKKAQHDAYKKLQQDQRRKILIEELQTQVDDYVENKYSLHIAFANNDFQKENKNLIPKIINKRNIEDDHLVEMKELQNDLRLIKGQFLSVYKQIKIE